MVRKNKLWEYIFFTAVWNGVQITCDSEYREPIRRLSIIQPSLFNFSLRSSYSLNSGLYQNGKNFFFACKFRQQPNREGEIHSGTFVHTYVHTYIRSGLDMTPFTTLHTCDVSHQVTWIETFSKWPSRIAINQSSLYLAGNLVLTTELKT